MFSPSRTAADTVRALHKLFTSRRSTGAWLVGGSAAVVAGVAVANSTDSNSNCLGCIDTSILVGVSSVATSPAWIMGLVAIGRFAPEKESRVVRTYEQTGKLPLRWQRKLKYNQLFAR